jgi:hypothetical protein
MPGPGRHRDCGAALAPMACAPTEKGPKCVILLPMTNRAGKGMNQFRQYGCSASNTHAEKIATSVPICKKNCKLYA